MIFADLVLSRRLERGEALAAADYIDARRRLGCAAEYAEFAGVLALYDGAESAATQAFGLGLAAPADAEALGAIERFFFDRDAPALHEVSPLAGVETAALLHERGYRPVELTTVLFAELPRSAPARSGRERPPTAVRIAGPADHEAWTRAAAAGWGMPDAPDLFRAAPMQQRSALFVAEIDGQAVATASVSLNDGVALLAGASTVLEWRGRGAQRALLDARLEYATAQGCELAMMGAAPGSGSQRNAERESFRVAYTRTKWRLDQRSR